MHVAVLQQKQEQAQRCVGASWRQRTANGRLADIAMLAPRWLPHHASPLHSHAGFFSHKAVALVGQALHVVVAGAGGRRGAPAWSDAVGAGLQERVQEGRV